MALELISALKFKIILPDTNLVLLVQVILQVFHFSFVLNKIDKIY